MPDPYQTLGVARDASADAIRAAYRKLAKKHHPDLNPGNKAAEATFKQVAAANAILSDPEQRGKFDRGEIDADGNAAPPRPRYRDYAQSGAGQRYASSAQSDGWDTDDIEAMFGSMFNQGGFTSGRQQGPMRGADQHYTLPTAFLDAVNGATSRLTLPDGTTLDVKIPPGSDDATILRLRGKGAPGREAGPAGDALIALKITPHPFFIREGADIKLDLPITITEAVLGGPVEVPTPAGPVRMRIPPHADNGTTLRLRGRGVPAHGTTAAGDLLATLRITIGTADPALETFLRDWKPDPVPNPRATMHTP